MANVQEKMGGYTLPARKTEFTFWWGDGYLPRLLILTCR